jgi:hypothetical protein
MISFSLLNEQVEALRSFCKKNLGAQEIYDISVDRPTPPLDELFFRKLVSWSYVLFFETGPFFRFSSNLLRAQPIEHTDFVRVRKLVECARTVHAHNLLAEREHDARRRRTYDIWLIENNGDLANWENYCSSLMKEISKVLLNIGDEWHRRCEIESDRQELMRDYELEKRTSWEAHEFDPFVLSAAQEAGLSGLDGTGFRKAGDRVTRWRKLAELFESREAAERAISRAIRTELFSVFGQDN